VRRKISFEFIKNRVVGLFPVDPEWDPWDDYQEDAGTVHLCIEL
jgi:hypothetical protein